MKYLTTSPEIEATIGSGRLKVREEIGVKASEQAEAIWRAFQSHTGHDRAIAGQLDSDGRVEFDQGTGCFTYFPKGGNGTVILNPRNTGDPLNRIILDVASKVHELTGSDQAPVIGRDPYAQSDMVDHLQEVQEYLTEIRKGRV